MALIPIDMLEQMRKTNLTPLTNPNKDQVIKKMGEMSAILDDENLSESLKASRFSEQLKNYLVFADKLVAPSNATISNTNTVKQHTTSIQNSDDSIFDSLPTTYRTPAKVLMSELKKYPHVIQWNPVSHEVSVKGKALKGSNLVDLVGHVLRSRKLAKVPVHGDSFLKMLASLNLPEDFIRNKYQISKFRSYKQNVDGNFDDIDDLEDDNAAATSYRQRQVVKAKKVLDETIGGRRRRRFDGTNRYLNPVKKFKWHPI